MSAICRRRTVAACAVQPVADAMADLTRIQKDFAAHLRDPDSVPAPAGIEDRRMAVYRELFFNNVRDLLAGTFPVCRAVLGPGRWSRLVRSFYRGHKAHTPYFLELPREFVEWLAGERPAEEDEPAFLAELAHYEWVELALSIAEAEGPAQAVDPDGDLLAGRPVLSPLAWPLAYRWPVHQLSAGFQPAEPPAAPTFVVVHRDADGRVGFLQVDAPTARLLELMDTDEGLAGNVLLSRVAAELGGGNAQELLEQGRRMLSTLRERGIVMGTARDTETNR